MHERMGILRRGDAYPFRMSNNSCSSNLHMDMSSLKNFTIKKVVAIVLEIKVD